jgi:hypothetical protein
MRGRATHSDIDSGPTDPDDRSECPVFICYRQDDGGDAAKWLYRALHGHVLPFVPPGHSTKPKLEVYYEQAAPAVGD